MLSEKSTIIGYTDRSTAMQGVAYKFTLAVIIVLGKILSSPAFS
jgi:hypothetical protein